MTDENKEYLNMVRQLIEIARVNDIFYLTTRQFTLFENAVMETLYQGFDS